MSNFAPVPVLSLAVPILSLVVPVLSLVELLLSSGIVIVEQENFFAAFCSLGLTMVETGPKLQAPEIYGRIGAY